MPTFRSPLPLLLTGAAAQMGTWWSPGPSDTTTASPGSPEAKCNMYPSCVAMLTNETFPKDGFCCPQGNGERMDCCIAGVAKELNKTKYNASTAVCVIDVMQAAQMLGRAGTSLNGAVKACVMDTTNPDPTQNQMARCAAPVGNVISSFSYAASFLSEAASECAESLHIKDFMESTLGWSPDWVNAKAEGMQLQAECAGAVTGFTAGLSQIAEAGPRITQTCQWEQFKPGSSEVSNTATEAEIKTNAENSMLLGDTKEEIVQQQQAECAFDIGQATMFLAQAGTQINSAVHDCSDYSLKVGGKHAKAMCSVDTAGVIRSFGFVASLLSFSVTNCPYFQVNLDAACSGAIADMVTGISGLAAAGSAFRDTCEFISNATKAILGV